MKTLATISAALLFLFLAVSVPVFSQEPSDHPQTRDEKTKNDERANDNKAPKPDEKSMKQDDHGMKNAGKQDDRGMKQDDHGMKNAGKQDDRGMKQDDRGMKNDNGMKQDEGKRDEERPNAKSQHEEAARPKQRQEDHADHGHQQRPVSEQRGQRIPDDKFRSHFGREHHFHVDRARIVNQSQPVIVYGGYSFQLVDAWPAEWSYDDDCYIDYVDDGYYLFDALHPGVRIAVIVLE